METDNDKYVLQSVETALSVLDLFMDHEELTAAETAKLLEMNRSKAFRFLVTLENCGYIIKTKELKYRLSAKVATLGQIAQSRQEIIGLIHPYVANITEITGESTHVSVMKDSIHSAFVDKCVGSRWLTMDIAIGHTQFAHASAGGKAMLAFETDQFVNTYLRTVTFQQYTDYSITDARGLLTELEDIRRTGYAADREQIDIGLTCLAVPILASGRPVAAISISGPTTRIVSKEKEFVELLKEAKKKIEEALS